MNRGIRPEFNEKLIELFENELREVRREDSLKIVKLHQEIEHLKLIIKSKDEEILRLKREEQPQPQQLIIALSLIIIIITPSYLTNLDVNQNHQ